MRHAEKHYNDGGWDVIVECWTTDEIAKQVRGCRTVKAAIQRMSDVVGVWADRQADADYHRRQATGEPEYKAKAVEPVRARIVAYQCHSYEPACDQEVYHFRASEHWIQLQQSIHPGDVLGIWTDEEYRKQWGKDYTPASPDEPLTGLDNSGHAYDLACWNAEQTNHLC